MFMALTSLLTGRTIRSDTAMTGEISLRGLVLPVGGIKEKVVAAAAAGITRVMLPARNRRDYDDIPEEVRKTLEFVWLERVEDAVGAALAAVESSSSPVSGEVASSYDDGGGEPSRTACQLEVIKPRNHRRGRPLRPVRRGTSPGTGEEMRALAQLQTRHAEQAGIVDRRIRAGVHARRLEGGFQAHLFGEAHGGLVAVGHVDRHGRWRRSSPPARRPAHAAISGEAA